MAGSDFLTQLSIAAKDAQAFFNAPGKKWLTAVMAGHNDDASSTALNVDRIYELMCYFSLLASLVEAGLTLKYVPGVGPGGYRLPYSPGNKSNFAFFRIEFDAAVYDLCCGTGIPSRGERADALEHPDISLQKVSGRNAPSSPGTLIAMWDAKYHTGKDISKGDIAQMLMWSTLLQQPPCEDGDVLERLCPPAFQVSAVVTNATAQPKYLKLFLDANFSVVLGFDGDVNASLPSPSREDHIAHRVTEGEKTPSGGAPSPPMKLSRFKRI